MGLHQQRVGRDRLGSDIRQSEYRRHHHDVRLHAVYEDRVRRAVNTPDAQGRCALWQGGMEPNIPVGSDGRRRSGDGKAVAGAEREQREGASGKWVAHWKMVHIVRPVWERAGAGEPARPIVSDTDVHGCRRARLWFSSSPRRGRCAAPAI